jgi:mRNA-degrading endonuclease RelE of RelBE toxin-antitoxin system
MKDCSTNDPPAGRGRDPESPPWVVILLKEPEKMLRRLPRDLREEIDRRLHGPGGLAEDPRPEDCVMLKGFRLYRIKVRHDWRIIYDVDDERREVVVTQIVPRSGAYRNL